MVQRTPLLFKKDEKSYTHLCGTMQILYESVWYSENPIHIYVVEWKILILSKFVWSKMCVVQ